MYLTIITVTKEPASGFKQTFESVLHEFGNIRGIEYLIKKWSPSAELEETEDCGFCDKKLIIRRISGKDQGVFDAMNQSIKAAKGEWILFVNAGDWLARGFGTRCLDAIIQSDVSDYIYFDGVTVDFKDRREFLRRAPDEVQLSDFVNSTPILHPCLLVRKSCLAQRLFDLQYDLAADFDLMVELVASVRKGKHIPAIAAFILSGGLSEQSRVRAKCQAFHSLTRHAPSVRFKVQSTVAFVRFLFIHVIILFVIRPLKPLRRFAKRCSGGQPEGTYS